MLVPEIYKLYNSHAYGKAESDSVSLKMKPIGAIWWLLKKHAIQLTIKILVIYIIYRAIFVLMVEGPQIISKSLKPKTEESAVSTEETTVSPALSDQKNNKEKELNIEQPIKEKILVYGKDYIVTTTGRKTIGELYEGQKIISVDYRSRTISLERVQDTRPETTPH